MIKHFLIVLFSSFIALVIFVNLFQFSGATMPFEYEAFTEGYDYDTHLFGFSSLLTFVKTIAVDKGINIGVKALSTGFSIIKQFSVDDIIALFANLRTAGDMDFGKIIFMLLGGIIKILVDFIVAPITWTIGVLIIIVGLISFIWNLFSIFILFMLGKYNTPIYSSGLLESLPNLLWCLQAHVRSC